MEKIFYDLYGIEIVVDNLLPEQIYYQCEDKFIERLEFLEKQIKKIKFDKELVEDFKKSIEYDDPKNFYRAVEKSCSDSISGSFLGDSEY